MPNSPPSTSTTLADNTLLNSRMPSSCNVCKASDGVLSRIPNISLSSLLTNSCSQHPSYALYNCSSVNPITHPPYYPCYYSSPNSDSSDSTCSSVLLDSSALSCPVSDSSTVTSSPISSSSNDKLQPVNINTANNATTPFFIHIPPPYL